MIQEPAVTKRPTPRRMTVLVPMIGLIVLSLCGIGVFAYLTARVGLVAELVGMGAALLPVGLVGSLRGDPDRAPDQQHRGSGR